jgi:hypothetical protein
VVGSSTKKWWFKSPTGQNSVFLDYLFLLLKLYSSTLKQRCSYIFHVHMQSRVSFLLGRFCHTGYGIPDFRAALQVQLFQKQKLGVQGIIPWLGEFSKMKMRL